MGTPFNTNQSVLKIILKQIIMQKKANKSHIRQLDQADCGVACLKAVLNYHGGNASIERIRELSGTSQQGTTMLGLLQAANKLGLQAEGFKADFASLRECKDICILHVVKEETLPHFVVFYEFDEDRNEYLIGDPAEASIEYMTEGELQKIWLSRSLLLLQTTEKLKSEQKQFLGKWNWLKALIKEDLNLLGIALFIGFIVAILGLATAIFSQKLIDDILPSKDWLRLVTGIALLSVLLFARAGIGYIRELLLLRQSRDFNIRIVDYFYSALINLPKPFFDNRKTGDLIARMNDTQRIQRTISSLISQVMIDALMLVVASIAIFTYNWQIGLVALLWIPVFGYIVYYYHPKIIQEQRQVMKTYASNESNYIDTIQGIGEIKLNNKQHIFSTITKNFYGFFQQASFSLGKVSIGYGIATQLVGTVFLIAIITWSAINVINGTMTTGGLMAILQMIGMIMASAGSLALVNIQIQEAKIAFDRMYEFTSIDSEYDEESEQPRSKLSAFIDLKVDGLNFRFPGRKLLLQEVSFHVTNGEFIAIMGESGSGKSTLAQIIQKFYTFESGKVKVNGIDLDLLSYSNWRSFLGVVPQQVKLFNGSVLDNVLLGTSVEDPKTLESFFKYYGFDRFFMQFPNGYATILGESGVNISGGQQQLVALARALYHQPQLLILDEPTAALDRDTEQFVLNLLFRLKETMGIIVLTHKLKTAKAADRVYIIENGALSTQGQHQELLEGDNLYSRAWKDLVGV